MVLLLARQPARHPRGRQVLRLPDLLLRPLAGRGDRRWAWSGRSSATCPRYPTAGARSLRRPLGPSGLSGAGRLALLRSFANGGSSLTGLEAVSNGVWVSSGPQGPNARQTLVVMTVHPGLLVLGVSLLACGETHAALRQRLAHGDLPGDQPSSGKARRHVMFMLVQLATVLILYTGGNTPSTASRSWPTSSPRTLLAPPADHPRPPAGLLQRDHRAHQLSLALIVAITAQVTSWCRSTRSACSPASPWPGPAWSSTTGPGRAHWRRSVSSTSRPRLSPLVVVLIFAVAKFTEGAWVVVIVFPSWCSA